MIFTSVTTLLSEQIKLIGTMKALGGTRWTIARSYLLTIEIYSTIGTTIGLALGLVLGYQLAAHLASTVQLDTGQLMEAGPFQVAPTVVVTSLAVGLLVPQLSALWPLRTGTRITVHEAIGAYGVRASSAGGRAVGHRVPWVPQTVWLGVRGLFRKPARVTLTLLALILSGAIFLGVQITGSSLRSLLTEQQSPIARPDIRVDLGDPSQRALTAIRSYPNVERVVPVAFADAILQQRRIFVTGVVTNDYRPHLVAGKWLGADEQGAVVLNAVAARTLHLHLGERVMVPLNIRTPTGQGEVRPVRWTIVGLTHALDYVSGSADATGSLGEAFTTLGTLNRAMGNPPDYADRLSVYAHDRSPGALRELRDRIQAALDRAGFQGADARTWQDLSQGLVDPLPTIYSLFNAVALLVAMVGLVSLTLTVAASVVDRRLEIGILRSMGATSRHVVTVFCIEALALAGIAWVFAADFGVPGGIAIVQLLGRFLGPFDVNFPPLLILTMLGFMMVIALLATIAPAFGAARVLIRETLRYE
jgi:putative ABC transport system permease protein